MKIIIFLLFLFIGINSTSVLGQISVHSDSINSVLCRKWIFKAIVVGNQRMTNMSESVSYEFFEDGRVNRISSKGKVENGKWEYKPNDKTVSVKFKKTKLKISELSTNELIVKVDDGKSENALAVGTVLKPADLE